MGITFFNNWKSNNEIILIEISYNAGVITMALFGFGIVIAF
jgi:hypothetical protein